jgi:hypothetical protein
MFERVVGYHNKSFGGGATNPDTMGGGRGHPQCAMRGGHSYLRCSPKVVAPSLIGTGVGDIRFV